MEAFWTRFFPAYEQLRDELANGTIGEVYQVTAGIGYDFAGNWRAWDKSVCAGSILDIGSYTIQLACQVFQGKRPVKVVAGGHLNEFEIDESSSTTLIYDNGKTATLQTHCKVELPNHATIVGTKGTITIGAPFWAPTKLVTPNKTFEYDLPVTSKEVNRPNSEGLAYQCIEVRRCIKNGLLESPIVSHEESLLIAELRDAIRKEVGVVYTQDFPPR